MKIHFCFAKLSVKTRPELYSNINRILLVFFTCLFISGRISAQCATTSTQSDCFFETSTFNLGVATFSSSTYSWYKDAVLVRGPFAGDGDPRSFNFDISSAADAGRYTVVREQPGCPPIEILVRNIYWVNPDITGLATTNITPYAVSFSWNSSGTGAKYRYEVSTSPTPGFGTSTTATAITVSSPALIPNTNYFIHVATECNFNNGTWVTIPFTTFGATVSCPGSSSSMTASNAGSGYTYQWQVATSGTNFTNISNGAPYSNVTTTTLNLTTPSTSFYGYKYRCVATKNGFPTITSNPNLLTFSVTWDGSSGTAWLTGANWNCNVAPDANTDVIIPLVANKPVVSSDVSCRKVTVASSSSITVNNGFKLTITGTGQ